MNRRSKRLYHGSFNNLAFTAVIFSIKPKDFAFR